MLISLLLANCHGHRNVWRFFQFKSNFPVIVRSGLSVWLFAGMAKIPKRARNHVTINNYFDIVTEIKAILHTYTCTRICLYQRSINICTKFVRTEYILNLNILTSCKFLKSTRDCSYVSSFLLLYTGVFDLPPWRSWAGTWSWRPNSCEERGLSDCRKVLITMHCGA